MFFLFKQKTAYEMRSSDWSSDVCSSYLFIISIAGAGASGDPVEDRGEPEKIIGEIPFDRRAQPVAGRRQIAIEHVLHPRNPQGRKVEARKRIALIVRRRPVHQQIGKVGDRVAQRRQFRSEEHTSELQSLMRISYAVFCLKTIHS